MIYMIGVDLPDELHVFGECTSEKEVGDLFTSIASKTEHPEELVIYSKPSEDSTAWKREQDLLDTLYKAL